jgi:four helix bundle protein
MERKEFAKDLEKGTRQFAVRIIPLSASLPNTPEARVIRNQITESGTSVGANYREANRSRSRADFRNKIDAFVKSQNIAQRCKEIKYKAYNINGLSLCSLGAL